MINLLLHGSVYLLRKELQCVRPGPDGHPDAGRSVWLLAIDCLFEHLNSLLKGIIFLNQSFDRLIDFIWSIRVIHLGPKLNKTHFYTRIQDLTETGITGQSGLTEFLTTYLFSLYKWFWKLWRLWYRLYNNDFDFCRTQFKSRSFGEFPQKSPKWQDWICSYISTFFMFT